jgi:hypothetical protein
MTTMRSLLTDESKKLNSESADLSKSDLTTRRIRRRRHIPAGLRRRLDT